MPYFAAGDGCRLFYRLHDNDTSFPVVVFFNGTTGTTLYWGAGAPVFSKQFRLLFYDARAQGQSDLGNKPLTLERHIADLKELCAYLGIDKAHLIGISHGARLALALAHDAPQMVDRLILCSLGAATNYRSRVTIQAWIKLLQLSGLEAMAWATLPTVFGNEFLRHQHKALPMIVAAVVKRNDSSALLAQLEALLQYPDPEPLPKGFARPTLVISGAADPLVSTSDARQLADQCNAQHEELAGIGHSIPAEAPGLFERIVMEFLTQDRLDNN
jgi:pimeloyl-ACP methyl ester carboxylesterase